MPKNIEIKAEIESCAEVAVRLIALQAEFSDTLQQDDTFFNCTNGRLKLREFADASAELIYYQRPDEAGPKESFYIRTPIADPVSLRESLALAHGIKGRVRKSRDLYFIDRTRVHLDTVEGLGEFLELEVVLLAEEDSRQGTEEANIILSSLQIPPTNLIQGAYLDLLSTREKDEL